VRCCGPPGILHTGYICIYIYIYVCIHIYLSTYPHTHTHIYICICIYIYIYITLLTFHSAPGRAPDPSASLARSGSIYMPAGPGSYTTRAREMSTSHLELARALSVYKTPTTRGQVTRVPRHMSSPQKQGHVWPPWTGRGSGD